MDKPSVGELSNSYTMGCPRVRIDNPLALASGLSYVHVDKHGITIYTTYISVDLAHHEIIRAKVGKGSIILFLPPLQLKHESSRDLQGLH